MGRRQQVFGSRATLRRHLLMCDKANLMQPLSGFVALMPMLLLWMTKFLTLRDCCRVKFDRDAKFALDDGA